MSWHSVSVSVMQSRAARRPTPEAPAATYKEVLLDVMHTHIHAYIHAYTDTPEDVAAPASAPVTVVQCSW
jgi:hypothetical protein